jgi:hypothetical protein
MKKRIFVCLALTSFLLLDCSNHSNLNVVKVSEKQVNQQDDGTIFLKMEKAGYYNDEKNPANNTAEWDVDISKTGHYKVWLSSATKDTMDLNYANKVRVNLLDSQFVERPACDKIIQKSDDISYPYYRADSYMGSIYITEPGEYNIQVISEKVISKTSENRLASLTDKTKLMAVILTPNIR